MNARALIAIALSAMATAFALAGCANPPGRPAADSVPVAPDKVLDFDSLYARNCAGCHGQNGKGGAAISLADPLYYAYADSSTIRNITADGVAGTAMPAFAQPAGGLLTDAQIDALVQGMRSRWQNPGALPHSEMPPYASTTAGNATKGAATFQTYCASCHGPAGKGTAHATGIVDPAFLALVSDHALRTTIVVGRSDLGSPNWCADVPGKCMSAQEISDVVAWLASQRAAYPGQPYADAPHTDGVQ